MKKLLSSFIFLFISFNSFGANKPNIIYILADDLGYGDLGCYGQKIIETPNIDNLAKNGMKFTNHHSGSTVCAPSRSCLLNGKHTGHVYVRTNGKDLQMRANPQDLTIATVLQQNGYHTAMVGKSGTGCDTEVGHANTKGFDYFYGFNTHSGAHHYFPPTIYKNDQAIHFPNNKLHTGDTYIHDNFISEIKSYLETHQNEPFFLHYAALIPHASLTAPENWIAKYRGKVDEAAPTKEGHYAGSKEPKATFAGMVSRLDWEVGEIMKKLKELNLLDNTIVMFASDNGPHSAGGNRADWFDSNGILKGEKRDLFEGGVRVPFVMRWPDKVAKNSNNNEMMHIVDLYNTFITLGGGSLKQDKRLDGMNMTDTLFEGKKSPRNEIVFEVSGSVRLPTIRSGDYKLVGNELYNIAKDPSEKNNIAGRYKQLVKKLKDKLKKYSNQRPPMEEIIDSSVLMSPAQPWVYGQSENANTPSWLKKLVKEVRATQPQEWAPGKTPWPQAPKDGKIIYTGDGR